MSALFGVPVDAAYHLVLALTTILTPVLGGLAAAAGVVLLTMAVRLLVMPLSFRAMRGQAAQARLAPRLAELRKRYGKQPERLQRELTALYAKEGTSMVAGIWPMLVQWPVFSVLYLLFRSASVAGGPNVLLTHDLFGASLGSHWLFANVVSAHGVVFLIVLAVLALVCWLSARIGRSMRQAPPPARGTETSPAGGAGLRFLLKFLPYVTVVIAAFTPLAACIYLITSMAWGAAERGVFLS
jgi:YidC/Oxa1 family membrane protein insertase